MKRKFVPMNAKTLFACKCENCEDGIVYRPHCLKCGKDATDGKMTCDHSEDENLADWETCPECEGTGVVRYYITLADIVRLAREQDWQIEVKQ